MASKKMPIKPRNEMDTVDVIFVSEEMVGEVILTRKEREKMLAKKMREEEKERQKEIGAEAPKEVKGRKRKAEDRESVTPPPLETPKKPKYVADDLEYALAALENCEVAAEPMNKPSTLFDENGDISAGKLYTFEADKRKSVSRSPLAKTAMINAATATPKSKGKPLLERIEEEEKPPSTPYSLRKRVIQDIKQIQKILENSDDEKDFSASESEYSEESSEEEDNDENGNESDAETKLQVKSFFEIPKSSKRTTRNSTNLSATRLSREAVDKIFEQINVGETHKPHVTQLLRTHVALYDKWDFILRHNYSVLLYGVGSKRDLIDKYLARFVSEHPIIKVNGFFPSISVSDILDQLCECLQIDNTGDALERIVSKIRDYDVVIYVGINNLDGVMLRSKKSQKAIAILARVPQIRLIASVDHINAPLMWDQCLLTDLNWVWLDATTFLPYTEETSYEGSILMQSSGRPTLASLRSVYVSLTKNARQMFLILAKTQVAAEKGWQGMAFRELYQEGRRQLLVSADSVLRLQLKEFITHAVVKQKRTADGEERFLISMENSILKQFLEQQEES